MVISHLAITMATLTLASHAAAAPSSPEPSSPTPTLTVSPPRPYWGLWPPSTEGSSHAAAAAEESPRPCKRARAPTITSGPASLRSVVKRILSPPWAEALAAGQKFLESQRYKTTYSQSQMKFSTAEACIIFAQSGRRNAHVYGVAVMAGPAVVGVPISHAPDLLHLLHEDLHPPFIEYVNGGIIFDYVLVDRVYDLRQERLTWAMLEARLEAAMPLMSQGFPSIGGPQLRDALINLCMALGVPERRPHHFSKPVAQSPAKVTAPAASDPPGNVPGTQALAPRGA